MSQDYEYDIFMSYRHQGPAYDCVTTYFYPLLERWLPEYVPIAYQPKIFVDKKEIAVGAEWPIELREALKTSRCILPVLSPEYFRSEWCCREFYTMIKRKNLLFQQTGRNTTRLIYPIIFASPNLLPPEVLRLQPRAMMEYATTQANFRENRKYEAFENEIKLICQDLWGVIQQVPNWQEWPMVSPEDIPPDIFNSSWKPGWS